MKLSKKEAIRLLKNWDITEVESIKKSEKGESNHNWVVNTRNSRFVLRRAPDFRNIKDLKFELLYLDRLKKEGFNYEIPVPLRNRKGKYLVNYKNGRWWAYKYIDGYIIEPVPIDLVPKIAKMLAEYHILLEKLNISNGKKKTSAFNRNKLQKELKSLRNKTFKIKNKKKKHRIFLKYVGGLLELLESLNERDYASLEQYPLHRDLNPENILWKGREISGVIDFENVGTMNDTFISDIAFALMFTATTEKNHKLNLKMVKTFFGAYERIRRLSQKEIKFFPDLIIAGFIEAFSWQYWLQLNDPSRTRLSRLSLYAKASRWIDDNKAIIARGLKR